MDISAIVATRDSYPTPFHAVLGEAARIRKEKEEAQRLADQQARQQGQQLGIRISPDRVQIWTAPLKEITEPNPLLARLSQAFDAAADREEQA